MRIPLPHNCSLEATWSWTPLFGFHSWAKRQVRSWYLGLGYLQLHYYGGWWPAQVSRRQRPTVAARVKGFAWVEVDGSARSLED